jgi:hypothetical protein
MATKRSKARIIRSIVESQYWDWVNAPVKVVGSGYFPDTVMVEYQNKKYEAYLKDLTELK